LSIILGETDFFRFFFANLHKFKGLQNVFSIFMQLDYDFSVNSSLVEPISAQITKNTKIDVLRLDKIHPLVSGNK